MTTPTGPATWAAQAAMDLLIPKVVSARATGDLFMLDSSASIIVSEPAAEVTAIGHYLADRLSPVTGFQLPILTTTGTPPKGSILLSIVRGDTAPVGGGNEGYELIITHDLVTVRANAPAGLFWGVQTIRQLLPPEIERTTLQPGPWSIPTGTIHDYPRFAWRGAMLDVARHFFGVADVKRFIDLLAYSKMNRLHLHLSDDQGWRLVINSWPKLATYGGTSAVGGSTGGYYTQAEYADIVAYAASRYITVVPEIDMPGHTNAALASYAELNCNDTAPDLYTGTKVGFSSLCIGKAITFTFMDNVVKEIAQLTPGPYFHIGGDESAATPMDDYLQFVERAQYIVSTHGKQTVGWEEIAYGKLLPGTIVQYWNIDRPEQAIPSSELIRKAVKEGAKVIMSPASKAYMDMKYDSSTPIGANWAGYVDIQRGYSWDPANIVDGVSEGDILGVEAPLWTETIQTLDDVEFMVFPRLLGYAEIGWSPANNRSWDEYTNRLGWQGARLEAMGVKFFKSAEVFWQ